MAGRSDWTLYVLRRWRLVNAGLLAAVCPIVLSNVLLAMLKFDDLTRFNNNVRHCEINKVVNDRLDREIYAI